MKTDSAVGADVGQAGDPAAVHPAEHAVLNHMWTARTARRSGAAADANRVRHVAFVPKTSPAAGVFWRHNLTHKSRIHLQCECYLAAVQAESSEYCLSQLPGALCAATHRILPLPCKPHGSATEQTSRHPLASETSIGGYTPSTLTVLGGCDGRIRWCWGHPSASMPSTLWCALQTESQMIEPVPDHPVYTFADSYKPASEQKERMHILDVGMA